ncbi:oligopeptide transporter, OPT family [Campylobacter lari]|uniref:OPT family oligopeptide transporter n=1 Tax=Campylobacter lari TaxID=201 RepID=UPI00127141E1|nr:oligopeptide transporter, OPT family [Campylobacter lari]EAJ5674338.1 oligopeptide transporter, OPT family [Campylobacter lari]EAK0767373.1 oligopeptide transporter, OPT family [Campylobacter lari]EAK5584097.1 oligopeptide transporter, OPT family [Campylobacter lari]EAK5585613.1 oligopeptide transporter, OPT family [Campylobacter lari]
MHTKNSLPELTLRGIILGSILTIIFTASNVYLGLKVGLTFSTSIPAVVIAMAVLKIFKDSNILENNMVQTQVSAAGTLSAVIFVIPGLFMCGYWFEFPLWLTFMLCLCGGGLGVLFTIPLRRAMVVESKLAYPEGRAAAEILKVANKDQADKKGKVGLKEITLGVAFASIISLFSSGFKLLSSGSSFAFIWQKMTFGFSMGYSVALLGAGYLVGIAGGVALLAGMVLAWMVFVPYFSAKESFDASLSALDIANQIWAQKVRLIGTGAIAIAALWTLIELTKPVYDGMKNMLKKTSLNLSQDPKDMDLSLKAMLGLFVLMCIGLFVSFYAFVADSNLASGYQILFALVGTLVAIFIGFFVASACGYMAGLVGSSSSPISGIGLIGIMISSLIILLLGYQVDLFSDPLMSKFAIAFAIFTTSVILATAAISNDNLQDLKTGYLVGATPWKQQVSLIIGCVFGALAIAPVLNLLYQAYGFVGAMPREGMDEANALAAPQANLMSTIAQGIFNANIDWSYIIAGAFVGVGIIIVDRLLRKKNMSLPPLAVGIGIYLPPAVNMPLFIGGLLAYLIKKRLEQRYAKNAHKKELIQEHEQKGTLFASGLIVGESLFGVLIAGLTVLSISRGGAEDPLAIVTSFKDDGIIGFVVFVAIMLIFARRVLKK